MGWAIIGSIVGAGTGVAFEFWACMYGDLLADLRAGTGGGGMSVRFSGDTDAFSSEPSVELAGKGNIA